MNEEGKSSIKLYIMSLSFFFFCFFVQRYYEMTGKDYPSPSEFTLFFQSTEFSEYVFIFVACAYLLVCFWCLSCILVNIVVYAVYFVQRFWYLHKLRKPERVYTGDPL